MRMLSVGIQKPTVRLSRQAKEFLNFLKREQVDGSIYFEKQKGKMLNIDEVLAQRNRAESRFPEIGYKNGVFHYRKGISIINYIALTKKATIGISSLSGRAYTDNLTVLHSLQRTIQNLYRHGLVGRFKCDRSYHFFSRG